MCKKCSKCDTTIDDNELRKLTNNLSTVKEFKKSGKCKGCQDKNEYDDYTILSYKTLRRLVGILALSTAFICIIGSLLFNNLTVQSSVSLYYYTNMRDFLEAVLIGIGIFIITYKGYVLLDRIINILTGIFGICIALFPCSSDIDYVGIFNIPSEVSNILHLITAGIFFGLLGFISFFLFTKSDGTITGIITKQKKIRNIIYRICGIIIALCGVAIGLSFAFLGEEIMNKYFIVLILEIIILTSFGISWLVKGETLFKDKI